MINQKHVLIAGGGIAGPTLALLLARAGHKSTIVEKAEKARNFGQGVDISGPGIKVVESLGLLDAIREKVTGEAGLRFVNAENQIMAEFPSDGSNSSQAITKEIEIMRGHLAELLCHSAESEQHVEVVYGDYVTNLNEQESKITVSFANSKDRDFDYVVAADGLYSKTRQLVFENSSVEVKNLGLCGALMSVPSTETDGNWGRWFHLTGGRSVVFRPCGRGTQRTGGYLTVCSDYAPTLARLPQDKQIEEFQRLFQGAGCEVDRMLSAMNSSPDLYFSGVAQVKATSWSKGRVALLGDAGYAPSPLTGQGVTLALVGAHILAGCIATYPDHQKSLQQYQIEMTPFVNKAQTLLPGVPWIANPQTATGIWTLRTVAWIITSMMKLGIGAWISWLLSPLIPFFQKDLKLPEYPLLLLGVS
nr:uncharacterized protein CFP56_43790 [Quercus suber]